MNRGPVQLYAGFRQYFLEVAQQQFVMPHLVEVSRFVLIVSRAHLRVIVAIRCIGCPDLLEKV
jgi:hypothetical protein